MGRSCVVIPSSNDVEASLTDESSDQNIQSQYFKFMYYDVSLASQTILICQYYLCCAVFYGLCETLFKLDQGLVCSSSCNIETMKIGILQCHYLLQPSEKGPMLLRVQATLPLFYFDL